MSIIFEFQLYDLKNLILQKQKKKTKHFKKVKILNLSYQMGYHIKAYYLLNLNIPLKCEMVESYAPYNPKTLESGII